MSEIYGEDLLLDDNDDIMFTEDGDIEITEGSQIVAQDLKQEFKTNKGDLFWETGFGRGLWKLIKDTEADENTILSYLREGAIEEPRIDPETVSVYRDDEGIYRLSYIPYGEVEARSLLFDLADMLEDEE